MQFSSLTWVHPVEAHDAGLSLNQRNEFVAEADIIRTEAAQHFVQGHLGLADLRPVG